MNEKTVVVAMSGGVDSSVAAALFLQEGYKVIGLTMRLWRDITQEDNFTAEKDAAEVAKLLGIEHHVVDFTNIFKNTVVDNFLQEYAAGRTPNPCVYCNQKLKFGALYTKAMELGGDYLSTGHYVRLGKDAQGNLRIKRAKYLAKDQSYVLYHLQQEILQHTLFPLGEYDKPQVRKLAEEMQLPVFSKKDSQEICFIPDNDHHRFLHIYSEHDDYPGDFVSSSGEVLGRHKGLSHYTVGQRKGLGLAAKEPLFVLSVDKIKNQVVLGFAKEALCKALVADELVFSDGSILKAPLACTVKIRYNAKPVAAVITPGANAKQAIVNFVTPLRGPAPGQYAVFYDNDICLGGGIITEGIKL
ncbi:MAG: tRNA 2-thiouridine(34) synthase MnmA [Acidaminococcaceae bacterium]|nr:tRNA 2-thiouridine(34) synthase MnmA [Acidaminococcaceae bacterium]MDD4722437.1 tRNA 2-thiouridine(34) synthase MnmA [Acidaminococcaceae bacterium]